jgi:DNA-directed RNA polymerase subunit RPC12/RpoP
MTDLPPAGQLVASDDGRTVQCHLCGRWFTNLGTHLTRGHRIALGDYREQFGLNRTTPLASPAWVQRHAEYIRATGGAERLRPHMHRPGRDLSPGKGKGMRQEGKERNRTAHLGRTFTMRQVEQTCPDCGARFLAPANREGQEIRCPECRPAHDAEVARQRSQRRREQARDLTSESGPKQHPCTNCGAPVERIRFSKTRPVLCDACLYQQMLAWQRSAYARRKQAKGTAK